MGVVAENESRWAPWYVYVVAIVGLNYVKQTFMDDVPVWLNVVVTVALVSVIVLGVTWAWRAIRQDSSGARR